VSLSFREFLDGIVKRKEGLTRTFTDTQIPLDLEISNYPFMKGKKGWALECPKEMKNSQNSKFFIFIYKVLLFHCPYRPSLYITYQISPNTPQHVHVTVQFSNTKELRHAWRYHTNLGYTATDLNLEERSV
jgi:hypothetical protein